MYHPFMMPQVHHNNLYPPNIYYAPGHTSFIMHPPYCRGLLAGQLGQAGVAVGRGKLAVALLAAEHHLVVLVHLLQQRGSEVSRGQQRSAGVTTQPHNAHALSVQLCMCACMKETVTMDHSQTPPCTGRGCLTCTSSRRLTAWPGRSADRT